MKFFPCPYCTRKGLSSFEPGDTTDMGDDEVGPIMVQISPDLPCGGCDGEGFVEVGSENHFRIKCGTIYDTIAKIFGEEFVDSLAEKEFKNFWCGVKHSLKSIKDLWLKRNKQKVKVDNAHRNG